MRTGRAHRSAPHYTYMAHQDELLPHDRAAFFRAVITEEPITTTSSAMAT